MSYYIYLTSNTNRTDPACLASINYISILSSGDGSSTIVLTQDPVSDPNLTLYTQSDAQALMNSWTDINNASLNPGDQQAVYVSLDNFFMNSNIKHIVIEQMNLYRIKRGYITDTDMNNLSTLQNFIAAYPMTMKNVSMGEAEMVYNGTVTLMNVNRK